MLRPPDCSRFVHPVSPKLCMLYLRHLIIQAVYISAVVILQNNSQSENSQSEAGHLCESLQKCLERCQRCRKYSAKLFQTNVC